MRRFAYLLMLCLCGWTAQADEVRTEKPTVLVVVGAPGLAEYGVQFRSWATNWEKAAKLAEARWVAIGLTPESAVTDRDLLQQSLATEAKEGSGELWIVLLGHGTFDGHEAKFNLRGPDFSSVELAEWLKPFHRPVAVIDTSSCSAPFIHDVSGTNRVVITATRSGSEESFTRFGEYLSQAIGDPAADLDKDGQTSLLEAFLLASRKTAQFYESKNRLTTEHALLDDNGDQLGTPADWFRGIRAVKKAKDDAVVDGLRAHQWHLIRNATEKALSPAVRARRDELEIAVEQLREEKPQLEEKEYYRRLEVLMLELARLYQSASPAPAK